MIALNCKCDNFSKNGKDRTKTKQRFRCKDCGRRWTELVNRPLADMRIELDRGALAIQLLVEGSSIRTTSRITKLSQDTISSLILKVGANCERFLAETIKDVETNFVECDEVWSFVGMKERTRKRRDYSKEFGDSRTFVAIDRETKLVLAHKVGKRDIETSYNFLGKLNKATTGRFQITTDGWGGYTNAVPITFGIFDRSSCECPE